MTPSRISTIETLSSPPPGPPERRLLTAAAVIVVALVTLTPWLLTTTPDVGASPIASTSATAPPQLAPPAPGPIGYIQFCHNSPSLCSGVAPTRLAIGYLQFCENSPSLCSGMAPTVRENGAGVSNPDIKERK
jgi:hypothetical protein